MNVDLKIIARDIGLVVKNSPLLWKLWFPLSDKKYAEHRHFKDFLTLNNNVPNPVGVAYNHPDRWFFANGIVSDRNAWHLQASMISSIFRKKIEALFNPTETILVDLAECVYGRTLNRKDTNVDDYIKELKPAIESGAEVNVIAYSQGGIIMSEVLSRLVEMDLDLSKLSVYTFGSAHDDFNFDGKVFSEHFANLGDYVASIGVLHFRAGKAPVYTADNCGHLLNAHYLYPFTKGEYCGGASKLYSLLKT